MNTLRSVFAALGNLAASINGLAGVVDLATGKLRQQLAIEGETAAPAILEHNGSDALDDSPSTNGMVKGRKGRTSA